MHSCSSIFHKMITVLVYNYCNRRIIRCIILVERPYSTNKTLQDITIVDIGHECSHGSIFMRDMIKDNSNKVFVAC